MQRFVVVFLYQNQIFEQAFDAADWSQAYVESKNHVPPQAVTVSICWVYQVTTKVRADRKHSEIYIDVTED